MKPQHSESFKKRLNNPLNEFKSEEEHIAHFKLRFNERFGVELSTEQYYEILNRVINSDFNLVVYKPSRMTMIVEMVIEGHLTWVFYGKKGISKESKEVIVPARLKTVLIPYTKYIVPVELKHKYDHTTFTEVVNIQIEKVKKFARQINLKKQNPYKVLNNLSPLLRPVAKAVFKNEGIITNSMIFAIVEYIKKK